MFLKNRNISSKIKRSKVTDYAALTCYKQNLNFLASQCSRGDWFESHFVEKKPEDRVCRDKKRGSSVVRHLPLVLEVPGSIPARGEKNFGVRTRFL